MYMQSDSCFGKEKKSQLTYSLAFRNLLLTLNTVDFNFILFLFYFDPFLIYIKKKKTVKSLEKYFLVKNQKLTGSKKSECKSKLVVRTELRHWLIFREEKKDQIPYVLNLKRVCFCIRTRRTRICCFLLVFFFSFQILMMARFKYIFLWK